MSSARIPYVPLGAFYFFYFAVIGGFMPYWGLYLQSLGFGAAEIGQLMAIVMATRIFAPNFWGYIADRTGKRLLLVRFGALMITLGWLGVFLAREFWPLALVLLAYGFFQNAILAQFESVTMAHLGEQRDRYSQVRLWGSLGFLLTVMVAGLISLPKAVITWSSLFKAVTVSVAGDVTPPLPATKGPVATTDKVLGTVMKLSLPLMLKPASLPEPM